MIESGIPADKILVAMDGSPMAKATAGLAMQLARLWHLPIEGLYVVDEALVLDMYASYAAELGTAAAVGSRSELVERFRERGDATLRWLEDACEKADLVVSSELLLGALPDSVLQHTDDTTLLALGRRGLGHTDDRSRLGRYFKAIAHHARQPVLVGDGEVGTVQRLLLAYDAGDTTARTLTWAAFLQRTLCAELAVVTSQDAAETGELSEMQDRLREHGLRDYRVVNSTGQPASQIIETAAESNADLIVVGRYHHPAVLERLAGSIPDRVLLGTSLPVLIA